MPPSPQLLMVNTMPPPSCLLSRQPRRPFFAALAGTPRGSPQLSWTELEALLCGPRILAHPLSSDLYTHVLLALHPFAPLSHCPNNSSCSKTMGTFYFSPYLAPRSMDGSGAWPFLWSPYIIMLVGGGDTRAAPSAGSWIGRLRLAEASFC